MFKASLALKHASKDATNTDSAPTSAWGQMHTMPFTHFPQYTQALFPHPYMQMPLSPFTGYMPSTPFAAGLSMASMPTKSSLPSSPPTINCTVAEFCESYGLGNQAVIGLENLGFQFGDDLNMVTAEEYMTAGSKPLEWRRVLRAYRELKQDAHYQTYYTQSYTQLWIACVGSYAEWVLKTHNVYKMTPTTWKAQLHNNLWIFSSLNFVPVLPDPLFYCRKDMRNWVIICVYLKTYHSWSSPQLDWDPESMAVRKWECSQNPQWFLKAHTSCELHSCQGSECSCPEGRDSSLAAGRWFSRNLESRMYNAPCHWQ